MFLQIAQRDPAEVSVQKFCLCGGTGSAQFLLQQGVGGGFVRNEMAAAKDTLVQCLQQS